MARKRRNGKAAQFSSDPSKLFGWKRNQPTNFTKMGSRYSTLLNIERKTFYFQKWDDGSYRISEEGKFYAEIFLDLGSLRWTADALKAARLCNGRYPFFRKWRCSNSILILQIFSNSKGRFGVLSKEPFKGRRSSIFIPEGERGDGWHNFIKKLETFLPLKSPVVTIPNLSYEKKEWIPLNREGFDEIDDESEPRIPVKLAFDPKKTIIIRRLKASDDWWLIRQAVEEKFKVMVNLRPCCGNLAVGLCASLQDAITVCNQELVSVGGMEVEVKWWDSKFLLEKQQMVFSSGWIEVLGIPPHLRTEEIVNKIADLCGGLTHPADIKGMWGLHENIFVRVKGHGDGFLHMGSSLTHENIIFPLRFIRCNKLEEEEVASESSVNLSSLDDNGQNDVLQNRELLAFEAKEEEVKKLAYVCDQNLLSEGLKKGKQSALEAGVSVVNESFIELVGAEDNYPDKGEGADVLSKAVLVEKDKDLLVMKGDGKKVVLEEGADSDGVTLVNSKGPPELVDDAGEHLAKIDVSDLILMEDAVEKDLLDENMETNSGDSSQENYDSDFEEKSFVSTPEHSIHSYEDFQLLCDLSPVLNPTRESSFYVNDTTPDFLKEDGIAVNNMAANSLLLASESFLLESMVRPVQKIVVVGEEYSGNLCEGSSSMLSLEELSGAKEAEAWGCCEVGAVSCFRERIIVSNREIDTLTEKDLPVCLGFLDTKAEGLDLSESFCSESKVGVFSDGDIPVVETPSRSVCGISVPPFCSLPNNSIWSLNHFQIPFHRFSQDVSSGLSPSCIRYTDRGGRSIEISVPNMNLSASEQSLKEHQFDGNRLLCSSLYAMDQENIAGKPNEFLQKSRVCLQDEVSSEILSDWARVSKLAGSLDVTIMATEVESAIPISKVEKMDSKLSSSTKGSNFKGMREIRGLFSNVNYEKRRTQEEGQGGNSSRC